MYRQSDQTWRNSLELSGMLAKELVAVLNLCYFLLEFSSVDNTPVQVLPGLHRPELHLVANILHFLTIFLHY